jgi:hypothetical protein
MEEREISETYTEDKRAYHLLLEKYISDSDSSELEKFEQFPKYVPRESFTKFLAGYELFKKVIHVHGSVVEGGVFAGGGLMGFAQVSAILEPTNFQRLIIGFDTFEGFPEISEDDSTSTSNKFRPGGLALDSYEDLMQCKKLYDKNRFLGHINKVVLVRGDATQTIPQYIEKNPYLVVSLLYLDFNLSEPTKVAIENFLPRMPKGSILAFDELNDPRCPGETLAVLNTMGIRNLKIERFNFEPRVSYVVLD